jgi:site-specific DNA recombinase
VVERQKILRLVVKEILVGSNAIRIRHSIPVSDSGPGTSGTGTPGPTSGSPRGRAETGSCLLRTGSRQSVASESVSALCVRCVDGAAVSASAV